MSGKPVFALAPALLGFVVFAQTLHPGLKKGPSIGGITEYDYANGLRVLLYPDPANPKLTVNVVYLVGSRHEGYGETGMAHLLEHMNFIETTDGRQIKNEIVAHGANWNGTTSYDRTDYFETVPATDENLKWALGLEADRMVKVKFTKQILDTEMTVVRNEFERGENNPQSVLDERVTSTAYLWHNYGKSPIGSKEDIEKVPVERLATFYRKYYQPDNVVLVITGRIDESKTLQYVSDTLGKIPRPARQLDQTYTVEPAQDGERYVELRRVGQNPSLIVAYHAPAAAHSDAAALQILVGVMSGGGRGGRGASPAEGRLRKALVDNKLADSVVMEFAQLHDPGLVEIMATLNKDQSLDAAKKAIFEALDGIVTEPPTRQEVERVKAGIGRNLENMLSDAQALGVNGLTTPISQGDWRLMFLQHDRVEKVTPEDLVRVAKTYFKASNRTIGYYIPDSNPDRTVVPATPDLTTLLANYKSGIHIQHGEAFDPTPANIEKRLLRGKLANGMKLVLLPKQTENNRVTAVVELRFGDQNSLKGRSAAAQFAGALLSRGTRTRTEQQIRDELQSLKATVQVSGGGGAGFGGRGGRGGALAGGGAIWSASANISSPTANFVAALRIAVEMLKDPTYPEKEFDQLRQQRIKALETVPTEPTQLGTELLSRHLSPWTKGDVLYPETREDQLAAVQKVTLADVRRFHDQFYGASSGAFAVVGPVDQTEFRKAAEELLGTWTTSMGYKPLAAAFQKAAPINTKIEAPDKANAQFEAGVRFQMSENDPDYPAMLLAGYMFGGPITSHLSDRIRNREGLSYGANARVAIPTDGDDSLFFATISLNPANGPKVESSFLDELAKTLKQGFTATEVAEAKKAYLDLRMISRAQDQSLSVLLAARELEDRDLHWDERLEQRIQALTPEQISTAFRRHIDAAAVSIVKAGDFKAADVYR